MKTNKLIIGLIVLISMLFSACVDIEVTTVLNSDGSLDRIVEVNSSSELKDYANLPFPIDSSWQISYKLDTTAKDKKHNYIFKKHYSSVDEMNNDYQNIANSLSKFNRKVKIENKFRWFYTYITYEEKYEKLAKGNYRPFNQYLSDIEKEARKFDKGDSAENIDNMDRKQVDAYLKDIDKKFEKWFEDNLKEEMLIAIEQDMKNNQVIEITKEALRAKSDTIYQLIDSLGGTDMKLQFYSSLNELFNTEEFDKIKKSKYSHLEEFEQRIEYIIKQTGFKYNLQMPGLLLDANTEVIKGNQLSWQFEPIEAFFIETSQKAKSRIINVWAFWVSGIFLLIVVIFLLLPVFKKSK